MLLDKALMKEIRKECRRKIKEKLAKPKNLADPLPRYDDVFFKGTEWLNSLARCPEEVRGGPMISAVNVTGWPNKDLKAFDAETGEDVSEHCAEVRILGGREAKAKMLKTDQDGSHYADEVTDGAASYFVPVLNISINKWTARKEGESYS